MFCRIESASSLRLFSFQLRHDKMPPHKRHKTDSAPQTDAAKSPAEAVFGGKLGAD